MSTILHRIVSGKVNTSDLVGTDTLSYIDQSPWKITPILKGNKNVIQHVGSLKVHGIFTCKDMFSLYVCMYETVIDNNDNYAIDPITGKHHKITKEFYFYEKTIDDRLFKISFTNVWIETVQPDEIMDIEKEVNWTVEFIADSYTVEEIIPIPLSKKIFVHENMSTGNPDVIYKINFDDYTYPWIEDRFHLGVTNDNNYQTRHQVMCLDDDYIYYVGRVGTNNNLLAIRKIRQNSMGHVARTTEVIYSMYPAIEQKGDYIYVVCGQWVYSPAKYLKVEKRNKSDLSLVTETNLNILGDIAYSYPYQKPSIIWDSVDPNILWIGAHDVSEMRPFIIKFDISTMSVVSYEWYTTIGQGYTPYLTEDTDYLYATFEYYDNTNMVKFSKASLGIVSQTNVGGNTIRNYGYTPYIIGDYIYFPTNNGTRGIYKRSKSGLVNQYSLGITNATGALLNFTDDPLAFFLLASSPTRILRVRDNTTAIVLEGTYNQTDYFSPVGYSARGKLGIDNPMIPIPSLVDFATWDSHVLGNLSMITRSPSTTALITAYDNTYPPYKLGYAYLTKIVGENKDLYCRFRFSPNLFDKSNAFNYFFIIQTREGKLLFGMTVSGVSDAVQQIWCWYYNYPTAAISTGSIGTMSNLESIDVEVHFRTGPGSGKFFVNIKKAGLDFANVMRQNLQNDDSGPITDLWIGSSPPYVFTHTEYYYSAFLCKALVDSLSNGDFESGVLGLWTTNNTSKVTVSRASKYTKSRGCQIDIQDGYIDQVLATPVLCSKIAWCDVWMRSSNEPIDYSIIATYTDLTTVTLSDTLNDTWSIVNIKPSLNPVKTLKSIRIIKTQPDDPLYPSTMYVDDAQCIVYGD